MEDNFSMDREGCGSGGNVSDGERWGAAGEALLAGPPLTSCCAARFLTGHRLVLAHGPGVGDPCYKIYSLFEYQNKRYSTDLDCVSKEGHSSSSHSPPTSNFRIYFPLPLSLDD